MVRKVSWVLAWWESEAYYLVFNDKNDYDILIISQSLINFYTIYYIYILFIYIQYITHLYKSIFKHALRRCYRSYWGAVQPWWIFGRAEIYGGYLGWPAQTFWKQFHGGLPFLKLTANAPEIRPGPSIPTIPLQGLLLLVSGWFRFGHIRKNQINFCGLWSV